MCFSLSIFSYLFNALVPFLLDGLSWWENSKRGTVHGITRVIDTKQWFVDDP